jgi:5-methylcytosine-specific restriction endonuclease McrA
MERAEYNLRYREEHAEEIRAKNKKLWEERGHIYQENQKAKFLSMTLEEQAQVLAERCAYHKAYYEENRGQILENKSAYYQENREEILEKKSAYYLQNRDHKLEYNARYYIENRAQLRAIARARYAMNAVEIKAAINAWRKNNRDIVRQWEKASAHNRRGAVGKITAADIRDIFEKGNGICTYCTKVIPEGESQIDHIIPIAKGGPNLRDNCTLACRTCNLRKHDSMPEDFLAILHTLPEIATE